MAACRSVDVLEDIVDQDRLEELVDYEVRDLQLAYPQLTTDEATCLYGLIQSITVISPRSFDALEVQGRV